ncbi:MAG: hypothetical protein ACTSP9_03050 [Promethearchaeota archaeon]
MKRLYICSFKECEWISAIVAHSHRRAKLVFYKIYRGVEDFLDEYLEIRVHLSKSKIDVSKLPLGEVDSDWAYSNEIYTRWD